MKEKYKDFVIPIYQHDFQLVVTDDIEQCLKSKRLKKILGPCEIEGELGGLCCHNSSQVFLFLKDKDLNHGMIAHELFHATHDILSSKEHELTKTAHEPHAYLCGYLTRLTYSQLKLWNIPVR